MGNCLDCSTTVRVCSTWRLLRKEGLCYKTFSPPQPDVHASNEFLMRWGNVYLQRPLCRQRKNCFKGNKRFLLSSTEMKFFAPGRRCSVSVTALV
jgi:hypothetical protein